MRLSEANTISSAKPASLSVIEKAGLVLFSLICLMFAVTRGWSSAFVLPAVLILLPSGIMQVGVARRKQLPILKLLAGVTLSMILVFSACSVASGDSEEVWSFGFMTTHAGSIITNFSQALSLGALVLAFVCEIAFGIISNRHPSK